LGPFLLGFPHFTVLKGLIFNLRSPAHRITIVHSRLLLVGLLCFRLFQVELEESFGILPLSPLTIRFIS
jgi:hypothetical protein